MSRDNYSDTLWKVSRLVEAAEFYLDEAFQNLDKCLEANLSGFIFEKFLSKINTNVEDDELFKSTNFSEDPLDIFRKEHQVLTNNTHNKIDRAWEAAMQIASASKFDFKNSEIIDSVNLLGHLNNFAFFFETLVNRHLLFLNLTDNISCLVFLKPCLF